jgi:hypothetical protein
MNKIHVQNFHVRLVYLETAVTEIIKLLQMRFDAALVEKLPPEVQAARAADDAYYGE